MSIKPLFYGKVIKGKLELDHPEAVKEHIKLFDNSDVQIIIEKRKKQRTTKQNAYYWGVIVPTLGDEFGYDKDEMHDALKWQFLRKEDDGWIPTVRSTADLSTSEWEDYMSRIRTWAAVEYNINIPEPDGPVTFGDDYFL